MPPQKLFEAQVQKQAAVTKTWNNRKLVLKSDGALEWFKETGERLNGFNLTGGQVRVEEDRINIRSAAGKSFSCRLQDASIVDEFLRCADQFATINYNPTAKTVSRVSRISRRGTASSSPSSSPGSSGSSSSVSSASGRGSGSRGSGSPGPGSSSSSSGAVVPAREAPTPPGAPPADPEVTTTTTITTTTTTTTTVVSLKNRPSSPPPGSSSSAGALEGPSDGSSSSSVKEEVKGEEELDIVFEEDEPSEGGQKSPASFATPASSGKREVTSSGKILVKAFIDPIIVESLGMGKNFLMKYIPIGPDELVSDVFKKIKTKLFHNTNDNNCDSSGWKMVLSGSGKLLDLNSPLGVVSDADDLYVLHKSTNRAHAQSLFYEAYTSENVMEGYLQKKGQNRQNWKLRYFVIDKEGLLSYYTSQTKGENLGSLPVIGSIITEKGGEVSIKIPTRTLCLKPGPQTSAIDMTRWKGVFQYHAQRAAGSKLSRKPENDARASVAISSPSTTKVILKAFVDETIMKELGLSDDFVTKSFSLNKDRVLDDIKAAVAAKLRIDKVKLEQSVVYDSTQGVILHENTKVGELTDNSSIFILHKNTNPVAAEEKYLNFATKEGYLQKRGQQSFPTSSWKTRFFTLEQNGVLTYYSDVNKTGEPLGFVYVRGAEILRTEIDILIKSITGRELSLRAAAEHEKAEFDEWANVLSWQSKKAASNEVAGSWKAMDRDGTSTTTEVGSVVRIRVFSSEGVDLGLMMGRADGHFAIYKVGEEVAESIPAFSFEKWRRRKFRANGTKAYELYGFRNAKTNMFISRSLTSTKLKSSSTFDESELVDLTTDRWRVFGFGMSDSERIGYSLKDPEKILCCGDASCANLTFKEELGKTEEKGKESEWVTVKEGESVGKGSAVVVTEEKRQWDILAAYLISQKLKQIKTLPHVIECENEKILCPALVGGHVIKVHVFKRFNSRKLPHLIELEMSTGEKQKFIFKEDDDISMDMTVMDLLRLCNTVWEKAGCPARIKTYTVVATTSCSGFCECISGDTMLKYDAEAIDHQLGSDPQKWRNFFSTLFAVITTTAAFDITDRHHNNVMFSPDGEVCLIDLSASLGFKAPMDSTLSINPVYFPDRFLKLRGYYVKRAAASGPEFEEKTGIDLIDWYKFEAMCMQAYYVLFTDPVVRAHTAQFQYDFPTPLKFLKYLTDRKDEGKNRRKEAMRNQIVTKMEESDTVARMVATITSVIPMN